MNLLFVIITPGGSKEQNCIALIPSNAITYDWEKMDGVIVNDVGEHNSEVCHQISQMYVRLGLEPGYKQDLKQYLNPKPPFTVDRVIRIGWAT